MGEDFFDVVIVNKEIPPASIQERYALEGSCMVRADVERLQGFGCQVIADDLMQFQQVVRHDAAKLNRWVRRLVQE
ncbi:Uncharacterised protein [Mycobacterium tuberculosis]|nr:Uncharacterised protein [Mycobacterium tuberculosis]